MVTKFQPPWQDDLFLQAKALEAWNGECAPKLIDLSDNHRVLTMERIPPSDPVELSPALLGMLGFEDVDAYLFACLQGVFPAIPGYKY